MRQVAFIRNVMQGRRGLTRALLLETFAEAGAAEVETFLTTGNVVFTPAESRSSGLVDRVVARLEARIGLREPVFVRTLADLRAAGDPFAGVSLDGVRERCVTFLPETHPPCRLYP